MPRMDEEFALVLDGVDRMTARMAQQVLAECEIPSLLHGADFDVAELGVAAHGQVRGVGVYVPASTLERASEVLAERFGTEADLAELDVLDEPGEPAGGRPDEPSDPHDPDDPDRPAGG